MYTIMGWEYILYASHVASSEEESVSGEFLQVWATTVLYSVPFARM